MEDSSSEFINWLNNNPEARAFMAMRDGKRIPLGLMVQLGLQAIFRDPFLYFVRNYPGGIGIKLRELYYKNKFNKMGRCVIIDEGVRIEGSNNISVSDFVWIDKNVSLLAGGGSISIGRRVHIAENVLIAGHGRIIIEDYVAIARGASLYSHSETIVGGKRLSGPMVPEYQKGMKTAPIKISKDALIGVNVLVLPGVTIGTGAIVGANSMVNKDVKDWDIVFGTPARVVGRRPKVTVEDI
ncbi:acyltransferase [Patescibacteria group bacterium]|nr:acyltransferase [Patescibacteria group bacterium]